MSPVKPVPAAPPNPVGSTLIERPHGAGRRLEDRLAGADDPVDKALANPPGRSASMRRAQDQLLHQEAARQAAILDALPAHVALLDVQGVIVSVNAMWRQFTDGNGLQSPGHGVGVNYLEVCERASGANAPPVELLRQRPDGSQAWVELRRHALRSGERWTIVTLARDITERKQAQAMLVEQMAELRRWSDVTVGCEGRILDLKHEVNELLLKVGQTPRYPSAES